MRLHGPAHGIVGRGGRGRGREGGRGGTHLSWALVKAQGWRKERVRP